MNICAVIPCRRLAWGETRARGLCLRRAKLSVQFVQDLEDCFTKAQIPQGARLAYVDTYEASKSHAAFLPLALSNTPSLLQRHTVHLYEPLEPDTYAEGHLNIGSFHSLGTAALTFQKDPINFTEKIRAVGGTHLIASNPSVLNSENQTVCTNSQGMPLFFKKINNAPATSFPQLNDVSPKALLTQDRSGLLFSKSKKTKTPQINSNIPIRWEKTETGWVGYPNPLDPLWGVCMVLLFLLMTFFFWRLRVTPQSSNEQTTSK